MKESLLYRPLCIVILSVFLFASHIAAEPAFPFPHAVKDTTVSVDSLQTHLPDSTIFADVDTVTIFDDSSVAVDTSLPSEQADDKEVAELLEAARTHYMAALQAQSEEDSSTSASEFEAAIVQLNELSYYPDIENNSDFNELTKSVIEDYEKYIATIDSLGPNNSVFALREKLNLDIEKIDITNIQIPESLIPQTDVPLTINKYTKRVIAFFMGKGRSYMEDWIRRSGKYLPLMKRIFREEGLPEELVYLAMPESGLNPVARSWAQAVGMWQFVKSTGRLYGLRSTYWYDERRDFVKATRAAAQHMKDLYRQFNDWHLVFVAYNAGGGWVRRGIRRSGSTDFWEMRRRLPRETRNYVPQYIAVTLMAMRPEAFGFGHIQKDDSLAFEYVTIDDCVDLSLLADCAGTDLATMKELNPELTRWCTPPNYKGYRLRIPADTKKQFVENYAKIPDDKKLDFATHTVRRGETVSGIAHRYHVPTSIVLDVNKISRRTLLRIGSTLVIPVQSKSVAAVVAEQRKNEIREREQAKKIRDEGRHISPSRRIAAARRDYVPPGRKKILYVVRKGETLGHIAEWFHDRASHIRNWNNIPYGRYIYPGQTLKIWVPEERYDEYKKIAGLSFADKQKSVNAEKRKRSVEDNGKDASNWIHHKIRRGESLDKIARQYDVAISDLKSWNRLLSSRIRAGQYLEIYAPNNDDESEDNEEPVRETPRTTKKSSSKSSSSSSINHTIRWGESLDKIARKYHVTISDLKRWNKLRSNVIHAGKSLVIYLPQADAGSQSWTAQNTAGSIDDTDNNIIIHIVRRGETLGGIALKYSVTISDVKRWNGLRSSRIYVGQKLKIQREEDSVEQMQNGKSRS